MSNFTLSMQRILSLNQASFIFETKTKFVKPSDIQLHRIRATLFAQFSGLNLDKMLSDIEIRISGKTKRIREIRDAKNNILLFSLRTSDGRFIPTFEAGLRMLKLGYENSRVTINAHAAPFVAAGKTAFCKHVINVDDRIVPGSEVLVIDPNEKLLGVGTAMQPGYAMIELEYGGAVRIKHYRDKAILNS